MKKNYPYRHMGCVCGLFRYLFGLCLLLWLTPATVRGENPSDSIITVPSSSAPSYAIDEDYILIFNSYSETAPWSGRVIAAVIEKLEELSPRTWVLTHDLNTILIQNETELRQVRRQIDSTYVHRPRMVVYVGSVSWVFLHEELERKWGLLPSVVLANVDFVGPRSYYLRKAAIPPEEREPFSEIVERYNGSLNVVSYPMYVRETMTMMRLLMPQMQELCFISDGTWISAQMRGEVRWTAQTDFPDLKVDYLTSTRLSTFDLIDSLYTLGPEAGVLYCSWIKQAEQRSNSVVEEAPYGIISKYTHQPVFVLLDIGIDTDSDVIGGYCTTQDTVLRTAREAVERSLLGEPGRSLTVRTARPVFDYLCMSRRNIDPNLLPDDTLFYWKPVGFFTQYRNLIVGGIGVCVLLLAVIVLLLRQRRQQLRALNYMDRYYTLFDNMPVGYAQIQILRDGQGEISDMVIRDVNPAFRTEFAMTDEMIDRSVGQWDPLQVQYARSTVDTVLRERRIVTTFHYVKRIGKYYKVVFVPSNRAGHVELFCSDNTVMLRTEERLLKTNRRLKTVLRTAEVIPWRWKLQRGTILFGLADSSKGRGEETEEDDSRFTLSVLYCFDRIHDEDRERVRQAFRELIEGRRVKLCERFRIEGTETLQQFDRVELRAVVDERDEAGKPLSLIGSLVGLPSSAGEDDVGA